MTRVGRWQVAPEPATIETSTINNASLFRAAGRGAYDATAEVSVYVATEYHRRGIGRRLKEFVIEQCPRLGVSTLLSMHFDHNLATRRINESLGFQQMGHLTEIAVVHGEKRGLVVWALRIPPDTTKGVPQGDTRP